MSRSARAPRRLARSLSIWYLFLVFPVYGGRLADFDERAAEGIYGVSLLLALAFRFAPRPQPAYLTEQP